jgi:23S rRNA (guanosine2251-2'-O)-methyltransferase
MKLNAKQLRLAKKEEGKGPDLKRNDIYIILDNILDTYNIGAIFRLADAVAARRVIISGQSETPPNHRIRKASINTTEFVDWSYFETATEAIKELRKEVKDITVVAIEQHAKSLPFNKFEYKKPIALVVGHETDGVSKEVLEMCDAVVELPMFGVNISLNVMVSLAIVLYEVVRVE